MQTARQRSAIVNSVLQTWEKRRTSAHPAKRAQHPPPAPREPTQQLAARSCASQSAVALAQAVRNVSRARNGRSYAWDRIGDSPSVLATPEAWIRSSMEKLVSRMIRDAFRGSSGRASRWLERALRAREGRAFASAFLGMGGAMGPHSTNARMRAT